MYWPTTCTVLLHTQYIRIVAMQTDITIYRCKLLARVHGRRCTYRAYVLTSNKLDKGTHPSLSSSVIHRRGATRYHRSRVKSSFHLPPHPREELADIFERISKRGNISMPLLNPSWKLTRYPIHTIALVDEHRTRIVTLVPDRAPYTLIDGTHAQIFVILLSGSIY